MDRGGAHELVVPLLASQILWINLVTDGAPALGLGLDPPSTRAMLRAPFRRGVRIVDRAMMQDIGIVAMLMAAGTVWVFLHAADSQSLELRRTMAFITLILFQLLNAFEARSSIESGLTGLSRSKWLLATVLVTLAIQIPLLHTRVFAHAFGVESLLLAQWAECALIATSVLWIMELVKWIRRRSMGGRDLQAFV